MNTKMDELNTIQTILSSWLDPTRDRPLLKSIPRVSLLLKELDDLNSNVSRLLGRDEVHRLDEESEQLARIFSQKLERIVDVLSVIVEISERTVTKNALRQMRDELFPEDIVNHFDNHAHRASFVVLTEMKLSLNMKNLMEGISYGYRTLLDDYNDWVVTGKTLGVVDKRRCRASSDTAHMVDKNELTLTGEKWRGLVKTVIALLDDETRVDEQTRRIILSPFRQAEARRGNALLRYEEGADEGADLDDNGLLF